VALTMLGADATHHHGGPVRLHVAPVHGYEGLERIERIEATAQVQPGAGRNATTTSNAVLSVGSVAAPLVPDPPSSTSRDH
jgi:DMSO/TMAO reductase YedYZ molybdopterin-dependent catalytic subunit